MSATLITNIKMLVNAREDYKLLRGNDLANLPVIENAYLIIEHKKIVAYGEMEDFVHHTQTITEVIDAEGQIVLPCWCDSHTHLVFAASRENEFVDKIKGKT
ncbi:MAG: imidazolonepropionase, partial [Chitinophagaceae bacterium]|nr:imidazolonepropionase [Chitinophagaceae bacterium]